MAYWIMSLNLVTQDFGFDGRQLCMIFALNEGRTNT